MVNGERDTKFNIIYAQSKHMVKPLTATSSKIYPQSPAYVLPDKLYTPKSGNNKLTDGDKEALSMIIASYAYTSDIRDMMRFVTVLSSTIQSYLVKTGRYNDYVVAFNEMNAYIAQARVLLDAKNHDKCAIILYSLETARLLNDQYNSKPSGS